MLQCLRHFGGSFIYKENSKGPKIEPWGMPAKIEKVAQSFDLNETWCVLPDKSEVNQLITEGDKPQNESLRKRMSW